MTDSDKVDKINPIDEVMTIAEAAEWAGVSRDSIEYQCNTYWIKEGDARKAVGGTVLINRRRVMGYRPQKNE